MLAVSQAVSERARVQTAVLAFLAEAPDRRHANPHPHLRDNLNGHYTKILKKENISFVPMILEMQ